MTMTDQELILKAAAAIGATEYTGPDDLSPPGVKLLNGVPTHYEGHGEWGYAWDPIINKADAFELMVTCGVEVRFLHATNMAEARISRANPMQDLIGTASLDFDPVGAAALAITRAAGLLAPQA